MAEETQTNPSAEDNGTAASEAGGSSQGGFSEAFAERAAPQDSAGKTPDTAADTSAATTEAPADKAGSSEAPSKEAADATSGTAAADPWAGLTPEQLDRIKKLEQSERSNRGRVGALTKQLNERLGGTQKPPESKTEEHRERSDEGAGGTDTGSTGEGGTQSDIEARLKAVTDEYGDIIGPVAEIVQDLRKEIAGLKASETRKQVDNDAAQLTEAYGQLEAKHPDYKEIPAKPEFAEWFGKQSAGIQALLNSFDPNEVSLGLQLFKTETAAKTSSADTTGEGKGGDGGTATGDRRERQKEALRQTPDRGAPAAAGTPNDFSSAFKARANKAA